MNNFWQDVLYGARCILRRPLPNSVIVLSLALGLGANAAVFSLIHSILLKPLPYPAPDSIVAVVESFPQAGNGQAATSPPNFADLRAQNRTLAHLAAFSQVAPILRLADTPPERLEGAAVTFEFFPSLGTTFLLGRGFTAEEDRASGPKVAVIGSNLWRQRFASDPGIIGKTITIDDNPHVVVGVARSEQAYPEGSAIWLPVGLDAAGSSRGARWLSMLGRLRPGVSLAQAQVEMNTLARRLEQTDPRTNENLRLTLYRLRDRLTGNVRNLLLLLMAVVGVVLLITCTNVASILLARFMEQEREFAIRVALGSSRGRLLRILFIETWLLSMVGGMVGLVLASWATSALVALSPTTIPRQQEIAVDASVFLFTLGLSLLTGFLIGPAPLLRRSTLKPASLVNSADRATGGRSLFVMRVNKILATFEVTLAALALIGAGLLVHSFLEIMSVPPGFQTDGAVALDLFLPEIRYKKPEAKESLYSELLAQVQMLPGVIKAGLIFPLPMSNIEYVLGFDVEGRSPKVSSDATVASVKFISPDLPKAMGIPLLRGRGFTPGDNLTAPAVAMVNQTLARDLWPGESPVGRRITFNASDKQNVTWLTIVGVLGDVRYRGLKEEPKPEIYRPLAQGPKIHSTLVIRSAAGISLSAATLRDRIRKVDPNLALEDFRTLRDVIARSTAQERFQSLLMGLFAMLALCLSAAGVFGILSYAVAQRRHEIGVRMALGATPLSIRRLVLWQGLQVVLLGLGLGVLLSSFTAQVFSRFLFRIGRIDPATLGFVAFLITGVGAAAILLATRKATSVDPIAVLRGD